MRRRALTVTLTVLAVASVTLAVLALRFRPKAEREDPATVEREIVHLAKLRDSLRAVVYEAALTSDVLDGQPEGGPAGKIRQIRISRRRDQCAGLRGGGADDP